MARVTLFLQEGRGGAVVLDGEHDDVAGVAQDVDGVVVVARRYVLPVHCTRVISDSGIPTTLWKYH